MNIKNEISDKLSSCRVDDEDASHNLLAYSGPVAEYIAQLEARIEELEARDELYEGLYHRMNFLEEENKNRRADVASIVDFHRKQVPSRIQAGNTSIDTRPGLSVQDVVDLSRAFRE